MSQSEVLLLVNCLSWGCFITGLLMGLALGYAIWKIK